MFYVLKTFFFYSHYFLSLSFSKSTTDINHPSRYQDSIPWNIFLSLLWKYAQFGKLGRQFEYEEPLISVDHFICRLRTVRLHTGSPALEIVPDDVLFEAKPLLEIPLLQKLKQFIDLMLMRPDRMCSSSVVISNACNVRLCLMTSRFNSWSVSHHKGVHSSIKT